MAKTFKGKLANPALDFITTDEQGAERPRAASKGNFKRERKTAHVHMLMRPSLHEAGTRAAESEGMSFSTLIEELLERYIDEREGEK